MKIIHFIKLNQKTIIIPICIFILVALLTPNNITDDIVFNLKRSDGTVANLTIENTHPHNDNPNLQLIKGDGRFIAEFSIISRE